jgi:hypothetical protein
MPRTSKKDTKPAATSTVEIDPPDEQLEMPPQDWELLATDDQVGFFDLLQMIPDGAWDQLTIYLYRLEPSVANKSGDKKYIQVYGTPITEHVVKEQHGGGKYEAYLKRVTQTIRRHKFSIEGEPKLLDGQNLRGGGPNAGTPAPAAAAMGSSASEVAELIKKVMELKGGDGHAAAMEIMKQAFQNALQLNKSVVESQLSSPTGNVLADKIVDVLIKRMDGPAPAAAAQEPMAAMMQQIKFVQEIAKIMRPEKTEQNPAPAAAGDPLAQFSLVKELLGVESLKDLISLGGSKQNWWEPFIPMVKEFLGRAPELYQQYVQDKERSFQRALIAHQMRAGAAPANPGVAVVPMAAASAPPAAPRSAINASSPEQLMGTIVDAIVKAYDEGYDGDVAAAHIKLSYPAYTDLLPLLADQDQLTKFVQHIPPLQERSVDLEWKEFQEDFLSEMLNKQLPPEKEAPQAASASG